MRLGPGNTRIGDRKQGHWFDGDGMVSLTRHLVPFNLSVAFSRLFLQRCISVSPGPRYGHSLWANKLQLLWTILDWLKQSTDGDAVVAFLLSLCASSPPVF